MGRQLLEDTALGSWLCSTETLAATIDVCVQSVREQVLWLFTFQYVNVLQLQEKKEALLHQKLAGQMLLGRLQRTEHQLQLLTVGGESTHAS